MFCRYFSKVFKVFEGFVGFFRFLGVLQVFSRCFVGVFLRFF